MAIEAKRVEGAVWVKIPVEDVLPLRVAIQPCPCRAPKTISTQDIRAALSKELARAFFQKPTGD